MQFESNLSSSPLSTSSLSLSSPSIPLPSSSPLPTTTSMSSSPLEYSSEYYLTVVDKLLSSGINFLAIDFDVR